jgi:phosphoglycolate phosphatase-like HAD superfamily hydrolase
VLKAKGLRDYFSVIVAAEDVEKGKPDPEGILKAMKLLHADMAVFIGDTIYDEKAAKAAGIAFLHVSKIRELPKLLEKIEKEMCLKKENREACEKVRLKE